MASIKIVTRDGLSIAKVYIFSQLSEIFNKSLEIYESWENT